MSGRSEEAERARRGIAADPFLPPEAATLGTLRALMAEIEELRQRLGTHPPNVPALRRMVLISQIPGIYDLHRYCNIELLQCVSIGALDEVARRLVRRLREPFDVIDQLTIGQAMAILNEQSLEAPAAFQENPTSNAPAELTPPARALAAAYDLQREGKPISLKAACERSRVDRKHLRDRYPETVVMIRRMALMSRLPRTGMVDRRTGNLDALDENDD